MVFLLSTVFIISTSAAGGDRLSPYIIARIIYKGHSSGVYYPKTRQDNIYIRQHHDTQVNVVELNLMMSICQYTWIGCFLHNFKLCSYDYEKRSRNGHLGKVYVTFLLFPRSQPQDHSVIMR